MDVGWNFRREHLRLSQRSHYVIRDGGDQPNVVPRTAAVWYFLRETDYPHTMEMFETAQQMAKGAAMMTGTKLDHVRILGSAWTPHFNRPVAEAMHRNIQRVGMPTWSMDDQTLAKAVQKETGQTPVGLDTAVSPLGRPMKEEDRHGGGSDDIGDVSWALPTVQLYYPSNIPETPGHSWIDAIASATPIAHKGATAGAKAQALTMLDLLLTPSLLSAAKDYYATVQTKDVKYQPFIRAEDRPATELNANIMARYRDEMRKYYFDPTRYKTYLEQLGIKYPTVRTGQD
jgi:aminobenzoyl-glutamate utilization protein B